MSFLKPTALLLFAIFLSGCQSPASHMLNNNFVSITPAPAPQHLAGLWTGSMGPYLATFRWAESGMGTFCYSYATADVRQKVKYADNLIHVQDGTRLEIVSLDEEQLVTNSPYAFGSESVFYPDNKLSNASLYCAEQLASN